MDDKLPDLMLNWPTKSKPHTFIALIVIILAVWIPRSQALDRFVTPDEPKWLTRSANFYLALSQRKFANTYQKEHPGVTIMWAGTGGFLRRYPAYVAAGSKPQSQSQRFRIFLENHSYSPLALLEAGRLILVLANTAILAVAFLSAIRLLSLVPALVGFLLIAFDPFHIALSRLLHPDGLVSTLILLALIAMLNYLYRGRSKLDLILAGLSAGLSWLTKSPALFLMPFFGILFFVEVIRSWQTDSQARLANAWRITWPFTLWLSVAILTFVILWPAMWVAPIESLKQLLSGASTYAMEGHTSATFFNGVIYPGGIPDWRFYPLNYFWRATPATIFGLGFALPALLVRRRSSFPRAYRPGIIALVWFGLTFTLFMTFSAKKFDRYLLPIFGPLNLVAGSGWIVLSKSLQNAINSKFYLGRFVKFTSRLGCVALVGAAIFSQLTTSYFTAPYYFSYYNPLAGGNSKAPGVMMIGWGEGLDQAARYLNAKPNGEKLRVQSWYPDGPFSYIFKGDSIVKDFSPDPLDLTNTDYVVLYYHQWQRRLPSEQFLKYFEQKIPEHIISIDGLEYTRIYHLKK